MPFVDFSGVEEGVLDMPDFPQASEGGRNVTLFRWLCAARARGAGDREVYALASRANEGFFPPLSDREVSACARSVVASYERGDATTPRRPLSQDMRRARVEPVPMAAGRADVSGVGSRAGADPLEQAASQLRSMFAEDDVVCVVWNPRRGYAFDGGRYAGGEGHWFRGWLTEDADGRDTLREVVGSRLEGGVYVVANALSDGMRRHDADVARYRNLLVESDDLPRERQLERLWALFGPTAPRPFRDKLRCVVDSGHKSLHGMVACKCRTADEYRAAATLVYRYCAENGLPPDPHCSNPARLTRLAGCMRGNDIQGLVWADA